MESPAQQQPTQATQPGFSFVHDDTLRVDWYTIRGGDRIPIAVRNRTTKPISVTLRLNDTEPRALSPWLSIEPTTLQLGPAEVSRATLGVRPIPPRELDRLLREPATPGGVAGSLYGGNPDGDHYFGEIVAYDPSSSASVSRPVHLSVLGPYPSPAVPSWSAIAYRSPLTGALAVDDEGEFLPVESAAQRSITPPNDAPLGVLVHESGDRISDAITVWAAGRVDRTRERLAGLELSFRGAEQIGTYRGNLYLDPERKAGKIGMTLLVTHSWVWAAVALVVGVALAMWLQFYIGVRRGQWQLRERSARLAERFRQIHTEVNALLPADLRSVYDVSTDFDLRLGAAEREITRLGAPPFVVPEEGSPSFQSVSETLSTLQTQVDAWFELCWNAQNLHAALTRRTIPSYGDPPYGSKLEKPLLFSSAESLVNRGVAQNSQRASLAEVQPALGRIVATRRGIQLWDELKQLADDLFVRLKEILGVLDDDSESKKEVADDAADLLSRARARLWEAADAGTLQDDSPRSDLKEASLKLAGLENDLPARNFGEPDLRGRSSRSATLAGLEGEKSLSALPTKSPSPQQRLQTAQYWRFLIRSWDWGFVVLAVIIAVLTGLGELYFDETVFGTPRDYVRAVLWGFGAKAGLEILREAIARIGLRFPRAAV